MGWVVGWGAVAVAMVRELWRTRVAVVVCWGKVRVRAEAKLELWMSPGRSHT